MLVIAAVVMLSFASAGANKGSDKVATLYNELARQGDFNQPSAAVLFDLLVKENVCDTVPVFNQLPSSEHKRLHIEAAMAKRHYVNSEYELALSEGKKAAELARKMNDTIVLSNTLSLISAAGQRTGRFEDAADAARQVIEIDEIRGNKHDLSSDYNNLAAIYVSFGLNESAKACIDHAISLEREVSDDDNAALSIRYAMAAEIYAKLDKTKEALEFAKRAYRIDSIAGDEARQGRRLAVIGNCQMALGNNAEAYTTYQRAVGLLKKHNDEYSLAAVYKNLGELLLEKGDLNQAIAVLRQGEYLADKNGNRYILNSIYDLLYKAYRHIDLSIAIDYLDKHHILNDSLINESARAKLSEMRVKYETAEKEAIINRQFSDIEDNRRDIIILAIVALVTTLLAATTAVMIVRYRKLAAQEHQLRRQRERLLSLVSHEIRSPLITLMTSIKMFKNSLGDDRKESQELLNNIMSSISNQLQMTSNLLSWGKLQIGSMPVSKINFDAIPAIDETQKLLRETLSQKQMTVVHDIPAQHVFVYADRQMFMTILRNLLHNAIKYSANGNDIILKVAEEGDNFAFYVIDKGIGVKPEIADKLFNTTVNSSLGTAGEAGIGYGLIICENLTKMNDGEISLAPEHRINGKGTAIRVAFAKSKKLQS